MKKTILTITAIVLAFALGVGGTIAYFTDVDNETNVFVTGNVDIDLVEKFEQNSKLVPATGSAQNGTLQNGVTKEVWVENHGTENAFVRVHIAIPQILDDGADTFDASANLVHFNFGNDTVGEGKWDWSKTTGAAYTGDWNYYEETIGEVVYNVYVVTYEKALATNEKTLNAIHQVYMDSEVTNEDIQEIKEVLGDNWEIKVVAEGAQEAGFANAYEALNAAFGVPGTYSVFQ